MSLTDKPSLPEDEKEEIENRLDRRITRQAELEEEQKTLEADTPTPKELENIDREKDRNLGAIQELADQLKNKNQ